MAPQCKLTTCTIADESKTLQKHGRPIGAKDKFPRRKIQGKETDTPEVAGTLKETNLTNASTPEEAKSTGQANERMNLPILSHTFESPEEKSPKEVFPEEEQKCLFSQAIKALYGLKQSGHMWYKQLSDYLLKEGYENDLICPCIFTKKSNFGFVIIAVYVDDLNLVRTPEELIKTAEYLKMEFEMKDLGKMKFCLGLQIEHLPNGILVHQSAYTEKDLKQFYMDKVHPLSTPMVVRSLDVNKDPFRPLEEGEDILGPEVPYMSAIGALMYLANCTRPDIAFSVNLLARCSSTPTQRHWKQIKHIFRYL
ncbi:hypothetical protein RHSIM_RhsimUnG0247500 [Rhododendron simsii]|uniref:Reverse transcriptase Ty1/copia-type domain-containing protein n=1 Tax=Rhododendron simsii TaxID=118357 RepID=A0A834FT87_RHOSS|nr:hypothetical protein RHSIM_RhsimUnG0247500 [Rhododendron simsii]